MMWATALLFASLGGAGGAIAVLVATSIGQRLRARDRWHRITTASAENPPYTRNEFLRWLCRELEQWHAAELAEEAARNPRFLAVRTRRQWLDDMNFWLHCC